MVVGVQIVTRLVPSHLEPSKMEDFEVYGMSLQGVGNDAEADGNNVCTPKL